MFSLILAAAMLGQYQYPDQPVVSTMLQPVPYGSPYGGQYPTFPPSYQPDPLYGYNYPYYPSVPYLRYGYYPYYGSYYGHHHHNHR